MLDCASGSDAQDDVVVAERHADRALLKATGSRTGGAAGGKHQGVRSTAMDTEWKQLTNNYLNDSWKNLCALELARLPQLLSPDPNFFVCLNWYGDPRFFCADLPGHSEPKD